MAPEIETPAVLIDLDVAERNIRRFQYYADAHGMNVRLTLRPTSWPRWPSASPSWCSAIPADTAVASPTPTPPGSWPKSSQIPPDFHSLAR